MEEKEFEAIKSIAKKKNKKSDGEDGRNYMTTYYAVLLKQKIEELNKMVAWRQENIKTLSSKRRKVKQNESSLSF